MELEHTGKSVINLEGSQRCLEAWGLLAANSAAFQLSWDQAGTGQTKGELAEALLICSHVVIEVVVTILFHSSAFSLELHLMWDKGVGRVTSTLNRHLIHGLGIFVTPFVAWA